MSNFRKKKIFIAGHNGMVGSAIFRSLGQNKDLEIIVQSRDELDLTDQHKVRSFFEEKRPEQVYLAAAKVGGIYANNNYPADFIYQNLIIQSNIIHSAFCCGTKKLLFLGSSCIYPKNCKQPMDENSLLTGLLEKTNEPYAISKIAGIKLCESYNRQYGKEFEIDYRSVMPTNLYGPGDNYHPENSHVIPGLIRRFHESKINNHKSILVWGTGKPRREFLYVDDMADASIYIMNLDKNIYDQNTKKMVSHINVGSGSDISIKELAYEIASVVGYNGQIKFDSSKPDGAMQKLMDSSKLHKMGWSHKTSLRQGLEKAYDNFVSRF